jgi:hypothetical protein
VALTLQAEQRLDSVNLVQFFDGQRATWLNYARQTYQFIRGNFPANSPIRRDDVAKALVPILEVNERLGEKLAESKLRQKFWISDFVDLIIDRTWAEISGAADGRQ